MSIVRSFSLSWGIFDYKGALLFDQYDRAHMYWSREMARNAVANNDWSDYSFPPHVAKIDYQQVKP